MAETVHPGASTPTPLPKCATGIHGLDEITNGGLPKGRPTLVCGSAGCGKTILAMEFLVRGAIEHGEPGVFMAFEESAEELTQNVRSLGFDLDDLIERNLLAVDYVHVERDEIEETGEYDLEGLFVRLNYAIDSIGARRVVLDTIETLFGGLSNAAILRSELRRLFRWLKDKGVTAIITGERGDNALTRQGLEEYVSDCVILLDNRISNQLSTRRLRIVKYRGTTHGTNEYPFLIDEQGVTVLPITSLNLDHHVSAERVSTGIPDLDRMFDGRGVYRGSSVLVSGTAGSGKSTVAAHFADAACRRGERCLLFAFEESPAQLIRNMRSVGLDLESWRTKGLLRIHASRPTLHGLEMHLTTMYREVRDFEPALVIVDPITNFLNAGSVTEAEAMLVRLIDFLKWRNITAVFASLTQSGGTGEQSEVGISSLVDTWILLRNSELSGERNRTLYIIKARGIAQSDQIREFALTPAGVQLKDPYVGPEGVLTGSARLAQQAKELAAKTLRQDEVERKQRDLERRRKALDTEITSLRLKHEAEEDEIRRLISEAEQREQQIELDQTNMERRRSNGPIQNVAP
ncbi:MAG: circadian clock protein KaiC [Gemmatimonadota bacterium]